LFIATEQRAVRGEGASAMIIAYIASIFTPLWLEPLYPQKVKTRTGFSIGLAKYGSPIFYEWLITKTIFYLGLFSLKKNTLSILK